MVSFTEFAENELPKSALSAVGFFAALVVHGWIGRNRQRRTFESMLSAIRAEADANCLVFGLGYEKWYPTEGVVLREFRVTTAQALLANPTFMTYLQDQDVELINSYVSTLSLVNSYRRVWEQEFFGHGKTHSWLNIVTKMIADQLEEAASLTQKILNIRLPPDHKRERGILSQRLNDAILEAKK
jgi:hypothetical protein